MNTRLTSIVVIVLALLAKSSDADSLTLEQTEFFESKIRPLLIERCYSCHSETKKIKGGLRLDSRVGWQAGGDTGPAAISGKPDESLLIKAVRYSDADLQMPPEGRLSDHEIKLLEEWIRIGAPDPREATGSPVPAKSDQNVAESHWAFQPLAMGRVPETVDEQWAANSIDDFILGQLESNGIPPSKDADRRHWIRRVSFDLTGLPPFPDVVESFVQDQSADAWERVVDRLLASPAFGPRWARPWLDLVGYADQIGSANNVPAEHAWRYRDYVVESMNADLPFDQFIREQLAGDLLEARNIEERQRQLVATGFLVLGNVNIVETDKLIMQMDLVDQQIEKVGKAFLGLTLNCVRCHDHKFDPITLIDYYGLAGIFASTDSTYRTERGVWSSVTKLELPETLDQFNRRQAAHLDYQQKADALNREIAEVKEQIQRLDLQIKSRKEGAQSEADPAISLEQLEKERGEWAAKAPKLELSRMHLEYLRPTTPVAFAVKDARQIHDARIQIRGNPHTLGAEVPRGFIHVASLGSSPAIHATQSGRLQLADWLTQSSSPLVSRVVANRVWSKLFGSGLVASVDYFGLRGDQPTHPQLLDHLADQMIRRGWSMKSLIRTIVLSRTYRQEATLNEASRTALKKDPDNRLLWRMSPRRLEAEMVRDAVLQVCGILNDSPGGPALAPQFSENVGGLDPKDVNPISFSLRKFRDNQMFLRTINLPVVRSSDQRGPGEVLNVFDFPQPAQFAGQRPTTAVASQSLFLLNGPLLKEAAGNLASRLLAMGQLTNNEERISSIYLTLLGRPPGPDESKAAILLVEMLDDSDSSAANESKAVELKTRWQQLIHALMASNEFLFRL